MNARNIISEFIHEQTSDHSCDTQVCETCRADADLLIKALESEGYVIVQASHVDPLYSPLQVPEHYRLAVSDPAHPGHNEAELEEADVQF